MVTKISLREKLAGLEHYQWSNFLKYLDGLYWCDETHENFEKRLNNWFVQAQQDYKSLSEEDKDKDRKWADFTIKLFSNKLRATLSKYRISRGSDVIKPKQIIKEVFE